MQDLAVVLTTIPAGQADAAALGQTIVEERLAACVNVLPAMTSIYRWQGAVETANEHQLVIKTTRGRLEALLRRIAELHPYDVPEVLVLPVLEASAPYGAWVRDSTINQA